MVFQYQAWGSNGVMLRVWREASQEHKALWVIMEDQGEEWREGRVILPSYDMEYRVRCSGKVCWIGRHLQHLYLSVSEPGPIYH